MSRLLALERRKPGGGMFGQVGRDEQRLAPFEALDQGEPSLVPQHEQTGREGIRIRRLVRDVPNRQACLESTRGVGSWADRRGELRLRRARGGLRDAASSSAWREVFAADLRSLAALRVGLGSALLVDLVLRSSDLRAFYTDRGVLPAGFWREAAPWTERLSLHLLGGSVGYEAALFVLAGAFALQLALGYATRVATIACWVLHVSLLARNPFILDSGDLLLALLLFWSMFLPLGARASLDRRLGRLPQDDGHDGGRVCSVAVAGLQLQIALLYVSTALLKLAQPEWRDGSAIAGALAKELATPLGRSLLDHPALLPWMTYATLVFELGAGLLLLSPWRTTALRSLLVPAFWAFHLAIAASYDIGLFPWICIIAFVAFVPGSWWDRTRAGRVVVPPGTPNPSRAAPIGRALAMAALVSMLWSHLDTLSGGRAMPRALDRLLGAFYLRQSWPMFVRVTHGGGWYVFAGLLADGRTVDVLDGRPLSFDKPEQSGGAMAGSRWKKLLSNILREPHAQIREPFARYVRDRWQSSHPETERLVDLALYYVEFAVADRRGSGLGYPPERHRDPPRELPPLNRFLIWRLDDAAAGGHSPPGAGRTLPVPAPLADQP